MKINFAKFLQQLFRRRPKPVEPPKPPATVDDIRIHCTVVGDMTDRPVLRVDDGSKAIAAVAKPGRVTFTLPGTTPPWGWSITFGGNEVRQPNPLPGAGDHEGPTLEYVPPVKKRPGVVRLVGRSFIDNAGVFLPNGASMFYALGHWHRGGPLRDLVKENAQWLQQRGVDYVRILAHVAWDAAQEITPNWANYQAELIELIDYLYDEAGLRVKITVTGGGRWEDIEKAAVAVRYAIAGREHKIFMVEAGNETNISGDDAVKVAKLFAGSGVLFATGRGNAGLDVIIRETELAGAPVACFHTERGGDEVRMVRQVWDFKEFRHAVENAEPPGPASSVSQLNDPLQLALFRVGSAFCGAGAFCLHSGSGVYGKNYMSAHGFRYAKFADHPGLQDAFDAMRAVTNAVPVNLAEWRPFNGGYGGPLSVELAAGDIGKIYGSRLDNQFIEIVFGCTTPVKLRALHRMEVRAVSVFTGAETGRWQLQAGETFDLPLAWGHLLIGNHI